MKSRRNAGTGLALPRPIALLGRGRRVAGAEEGKGTGQKPPTEFEPNTGAATTGPSTSLSTDAPVTSLVVFADTLPVDALRDRTRAAARRVVFTRN